MHIKYAHSSKAWGGSFDYIENAIRTTGAKRILEVGGGANPTFPLDYIRRHELEYTVLDISADELAKSPDGYLKVCADITSPQLALFGGYDFIFSKMLAEHVENGEIFHRNVYRLLAANGCAFRLFKKFIARFPTGW